MFYLKDRDRPEGTTHSIHHFVSAVGWSIVELFGACNEKQLRGTKEDEDQPAVVEHSILRLSFSGHKCCLIDGLLKGFLNILMMSSRVVVCCSCCRGEDLLAVG